MCDPLKRFCRVKQNHLNTKVDLKQCKAMVSLDYITFSDALLIFIDFIDYGWMWPECWSSEWICFMHFRPLPHPWMSDGWLQELQVQDQQKIWGG